MTSSSFLTDPNQILVADASVLINLNATGYATQIILCFPGSFVVTSCALAELELGAAKGHNDAKLVRNLITDGTVHLVDLSDCGHTLYRSLIDGTTEQTLDDGEAATIAYAHQISGVALIDERKARSICATCYPALAIASTVDLLTHSMVEQSLGRDRQILSVANALRLARMRVPPHQRELVVDLIGTSEALNCNSLPRRHRTPP
jgi:predicted nucleic acid-binding protein